MLPRFYICKLKNKKWRSYVKKGLILSNISNLYKVEINEKIYDCNARGKIKNNETSPVAGDIAKVEIIDEEKSTGVITEIEERKNYIKRPKMANLTQIILVISMKFPKPDLELLDKQLAYLEFNNIKPIICLNKIDLEKEEKINDICNTYTKVGYTVIKTDAKEGKGIKELQQCLNNNITAFSGNSGVGKSTLINNILGENTTQEGIISEKNKRGKNTTTQVRLYKISQNTYIADTPGFSTFDIKEIDKKELAKFFIEFRPYMNSCEYIDCSHIKEKECGVKKALEEGKISQDRYDRYCKLYGTLEKQ